MRVCYAVAEGYHLMQLGQSPYAGFAYHGSPLLVALLGPLAPRRLSPYAIAACAGGSTAPYENLAVLLAVRSAAAGDIPMAAFGFVLAVHLSLYPITLIVPILLLLCRGPDRPKLAKRLAPTPTLQAHRHDKQSRSVSASAAAAECDNSEAEAAGSSERVDRALRAWRGWPPGAVETSLFALWSALWGAALAALCTLALRQHGGAAAVLPKCAAKAKSNSDDLMNIRIGFTCFHLSHAVRAWAAVASGQQRRAGLARLSTQARCQLAPSSLPPPSLLPTARRTWGFTLLVQDYSPNLGVFWYFFAEVFEHFRVFFAFAFHAAAVLLLPPLALRLAHRPLFLAFAYTATTSLLKSYPSVGDTALYLGLASLFMPQLAGMRFLGIISFGFAYVAAMGLVMYDLWIWK
eukprot:SM000134S26930  [mRNA]  locus=s134:86:2759:- [translate_table: standard]